ncbi:DUF2332 domain-containing protein [Amylibacter sp. IMCC11727]|uniref:DUF2332 domain-containing protein n=1 Tax=Amylibacter sp. IMCC11727 TaxID=3039851 RepID=UPI00244DA686|nr:DUF2332 domain-containing protein [Amylibacter sp. IMCC11727]WGI21572.1 DUF2332 domain-containing protein [Amylibacter sp. IMCC11727]
MALDSLAFEQQAEWCRKLGSELTARVLEALVQVLDDSTATGRLVCDWPGEAGPMKDVVPLRLTGALHAMVASGQADGLAAVYPPNAIAPVADLVPLVRGAVGDCDAQIMDFLQFSPQTNEVARAAVLIAGLSVVASETGLPLAVHEIGASGGLNLNLDKFGYQLGDVSLGDAASGVQLAPKWTGDAPRMMPQIVARSGCDLNPIDVTDADQALRLQSYVWADQADRLDRVKAAISIAQKHPPHLDAMDAADWVGQLNRFPPKKDQCRVLMHSIAWQYMPEAVQRRIQLSMEGAGARGDQVAWVAFELNADGQAELTVRIWPDGGKRVVAEANPHVQWVKWLG